jgi:hypothetical protein
LYGEELPYKVVNGASDEVLARAANLIIGRASYETAIRLFPDDLIQFRNGPELLAVSLAAHSSSAMLIDEIEWEPYPPNNSYKVATVTTEPEHVAIVCSMYEFDKNRPYTIRIFPPGETKDRGWQRLDKVTAQILLDALRDNPNLIYEAPDLAVLERGS